MSLSLHQQEVLCQPPISHVENTKRVADANDENHKLAFAIAEHGSALLSSLAADESDSSEPDHEDEMLSYALRCGSSTVISLTKAH